MQEEKKQIHIQVRNKIATFVSMNFTLVGGNSDYEVVFDFDSEWAKYPVKTALFIYADETKKVVIDGNTCKGIPIEKATVCLIGAFAGDIYTTTPACIRDIKLSIRDMATSLPEPPTEDVYNQIMELLNRYINEASGLPSGGAKGQVLKKASDSDFDVAWSDEEKGSNVNEEDILRVVKQYIEQNPPKDGFSPTVEIIPIDNGYSVNITDKNGVHSYAIYNGVDGKDGINGRDGVSATHSWNGTTLTITSASGTSSADLKGEKGEKGERGEQGIQGLQGVQGIQGLQGVQGEKGDKGDGFSISKTYISVATMNAGFYTDDVPLNGFVLINTGNVNDVDNAKLFVKTLTGYSYLTDLSGSQGIKGDKGDKGDQGIQGEQGIRGEQGIQGIQGEKGEDGANGKDGENGADGVGIANIAKTSTDGKTDTYTITLTNGNEFTFTVTNGTDGTNGKDGEDGKNGSDGKDGQDGKTAYEYAKEGGYTGTEQEFAQKIAQKIPSKTSDLTNDSGFIKASEAPIQSVNGKTGTVQLSATDVGARPSAWTPTYSDVGADKAGEAESSVSVHNTSPDSHNDIRLLIQGLYDRINAVLDSDDTTLDELSEIVTYIKSNKTLIDSITTSKVNVVDIVNNLTTNVTNKPLSAAQGVALKEIAYNLKDACVEKNQGAANVGKILVVGADGNLTLADMPEGGVSGDVIGMVDENNNIVITGSLANGTYVFKYEGADGTYADIGSLVIGGVVQYSITAKLTECTAVSGNATVINAGETVTLKYVAKDGFALTDSVAVSGASYTWDSATGTLMLSNPTSDVTVAITATKSGVTNLADPTAVGWVNNSRIGSDGANKAEGACQGAVVTNFIPVGDKTLPIYIKGLDIINKLPDNNEALHSRYSGMDVSTYVSKFYGKNITGDCTVIGDVTEFTIGSNALTNEYIRFTGTLLSGYTANDVVITLGESIE